jgi:hypothetical protein
LELRKRKAKRLEYERNHPVTRKESPLNRLSDNESSTDHRNGHANGASPKVDEEDEEEEKA